MQLELHLRKNLCILLPIPLKKWRESVPNVKRVLQLIAIICMIQSVQAQEMQVSIDQEGKIFVVDLELRQKLGMFSEFNDFQEARLFQAGDSIFVLEINYQQDGQSMKKREQMNAAQVMDLRSRVSQGIHRSNYNAGIDQSGRSKFLSNVIGLSLGYYGWAVPIMLEPDDDKVTIGLYLLTGGAMYLTANAISAKKEITNASATAFQYGATRGIIHSLAFYSLLTGTESKIRWAIPSGALGGIIEGIGLMLSVHNNNTSVGRVNAWGVVEDFGIGIGVGCAYLTRAGDQFDVHETDLSLLGGMTLLGSGAGYLTGSLLTANTSYSNGDADILQTCGMLGAGLAFTVADLTGMEKRKPLITTSMLGAITGLVVGHSLTSAYDFSDDAGTSVRLVTSAGIVIGLGTAYIIAKESADRTIYLSLASLGAIGGFALAYSSAEKEASPTNQNHSWNIKIDPLGMTTTLFRPNGQRVIQQSPALRFEYRF